MTLKGYDLLAWLERQKKFSEKTFGPGDRIDTISAHILKELEEAKAAKTLDASLEEWIDVAIMALDQCWRVTGGDLGKVVMALHQKQQVNIRRTWQDWRTVPAGQPVEHVRNNDVPLNGVQEAKSQP